MTSTEWGLVLAFLIWIAILYFGIQFGKYRKRDMGELETYHDEDVLAQKVLTEKIQLADGNTARLTIRVDILRDRVQALEDRKNNP